MHVHLVSLDVALFVAINEVDLALCLGLPILLECSLLYALVIVVNKMS